MSNICCPFCATCRFEMFESLCNHIFKNHIFLPSSAIWSSYHSECLAHLECLFGIYCPDDRLINISLSRTFNGRSRHEIKKHRASSRYRKILQEVKHMYVIPENVVDITGDSSTGSDLFDVLYIFDDEDEDYPSNFDQNVDLGNLRSNQSLDINPSSSKSSSGIFTCLYCCRSFSSKIGLGQHKRAAHFQNYLLEAQLNKGTRKYEKWDDKELHFLALCEHGLLSSPNVPLFINIELQKKLPHRTTSQIKEIRKTARYKSTKAKIDDDHSDGCSPSSNSSGT